jgi:hypothetical protein
MLTPMNLKMLEESAVAVAEILRKYIGDYESAPDDPAWPEAAEDLETAMNVVRQRLGIKPSDKKSKKAR